MKEIIINGNYNSAKCFCVDDDKYDIDQYAKAQVKAICDNKIFKDAQIRLMPDVHAGKVGPIGLSIMYSHIPDKIIPNLIGSDIGCGITIMKINKNKITKGDLQKLDTIIKDYIPSGSNRHNIGKNHFNSPDINKYFEDIDNIIKYDLAISYIGTLGGGNHFIEIDKDEENNDYYIIVHSGSRFIGQCINKYYNNKGQEYLKKNNINIPFEVTYLEGELKRDYLNTVKSCQFIASLNRSEIIKRICNGMKWDNDYKYIHISHNYIESHFLDESFFIRKGCISSTSNNLVVIPINMRDGIILGEGKSNIDWNYSAPHGSGRIIKRSEVKNSYNLPMYKKEMKGIYSSSISKDTLDEAPFAYRNIDLIKEAIKSTVDITNILKPIYNFKAGGND